MIWSASSIFNTLSQVLNKIWGNHRAYSIWKRRGLAIISVLTLIGPALILASFAGSMVANLRSWLPDQIIPIGDGIGILVAILFDIALFMLIYILLPHGRASWREILPGAVGAGMLWELAKKGFLSFVSTYISISNLVYGSVATIIAFLVWAYLSSIIFLFGAYLSVAYSRLKQQEGQKN